MRGKTYKRFSVLGCMVFFMAVLLQLSVLGAEETKGSISLTVAQEYADLAEMTIYPIADFENAGSFVYREEFADCGVKFEELDWNNAEEAFTAAQTLADFAKEQGIEGIAAKADAEGNINFSDLAPALYVAAQTKGQETVEIQPLLVPIPYTDGNGTKQYHADLTPKCDFPGGAVIVKKVDDTTEKNPLADAVFALQQKMLLEEGEEAPEGVETLQDEQNGNYYWKEFEADLVSNENGQIVVKDLPLGDFRFVETKAPEGFVENGTIAEFSITEAGQVAEIDGIYLNDENAAGEAAEVEVVNHRISVRINKVDENGEAVVGAQIVLKDKDGNVIRDEETGYAKYSFTTREEPFDLKQIPAGDYIISEIAPPESGEYLLAQDIPITISNEDGVVNEFSMVDYHKPEEEKGVIQVTKKLNIVNDEDVTLLLSPRSADFYVALFEDEACTKRISEVKKLHYENTNSSTVTFENLDLDKTYYVSETDAYGAVSNKGTQDGKEYAAVYPNEKQDVEITEVQPKAEYEFDNVFVEAPEHYYYSGELTVTKKLLKGGEPYQTKATFYAAVFKDKELTERADTPIITLALDGTDEVSQSVSVEIGENKEDTATYYVAETDEEGVPVQGGTAYGYEVSVDHTEVTFDSENLEQQVVITNDAIENKNGSIKITKKIVDGNYEELYTKNGTFYVALFEEETYQTMLAGPEKITFENQQANSVTFTGLTLGKTYYLAETDENGEVLPDMGVTEDGYQYNPIYPEVASVELTEAAPQGELEFENMFPENPPEYYYVGNLNITKRVIKNGNPYNTDAAFYAAIFTDKELKNRYNDEVYVLDLNGGNEVSGDMEVYIGEHEGDTATYYIAETDEDGNPVESGAGFGYKVSIDKAELVFTPQSLDQKAVITNEVEEEEEEGPTPTPTSSTPNGSTPNGSTPNGGSSGSSPVKTGDDTPILMYVVLLAAAILIGGGVFVYRKKK